MRFYLAVRLAIAAYIIVFGLPSVLYNSLGNQMRIGSYLPNNPGSTGEVTAFQNQAGLTLDITSYYTSSFGQPFPLAFAQAMAKQGTQVLVQWQPRGTTNQAIAAGQQDAAITAMAQAVAQVNSTVIISYGQEMNGNWYPWGNVPPNTPAEYVAAYQHIWKLFQQAGTYNVNWLWDPNIGSSPLKPWYPGDQYVDWVGLDGYFNTQSTTFTQLFLPSIQELRTFTFKPLVIGESGVTGASAPQQLQELFEGAALAGAIALVYFNESQSPLSPGDTEHQDWALGDNPAAMAAFKYLASVYADRPLIHPVQP